MYACTCVRAYALSSSSSVDIGRCSRIHCSYKVESRRERKGKKRGWSCSALEQFLDAYCHALLSLESTAITGQLGNRRSTEGRRCSWKIVSLATAILLRPRAAHIPTADISLIIFTDATLMSFNNIRRTYSNIDDSSQTLKADLSLCSDRKKKIVSLDSHASSRRMLDHTRVPHRVCKREIRRGGPRVDERPVFPDQPLA